MSYVVLDEVTEANTDHFQRAQTKKTSLFWVSPNNLSKTNCVPFPLHLYERHHLSRGTILKKYHEYLIKQRAACWRTSSLGAFTWTQRKRTSKYDLRRYSEEGSGN